MNFHIGRTEIPVGLGLITLFLFTLAVVNVVTKQVATIAGLTFTLAFFAVFEVTEIYNRRKMKLADETVGHEKFRLEASEDVTVHDLSVRPGNVLVAVRNPNRLSHLKRVLEKTDTNKLDIVVVSVRRVTGEFEWTTDELFAKRETDLYTRVVSLAEKMGKTVKLLVVPGTEPVQALVQTAARLESARIVVGTSPRQTISEQGLDVGRQWEKLPEPRPSMSLEVVPDDGGRPTFYNLGPHPPRLWPEDIALLHSLWLELSQNGPGHKLHHRDVVGLALKRLKAELDGKQRAEILGEVGGYDREEEPQGDSDADATS